MNDRTAYYTTTDTNLAASLLALGIPAAKEPFTKHRSINSDKSIFTFYFEDVSLCGKYKTGECIKMWGDPEQYLDSHHPLAFMKCLILNRNGLLDVINQAVEMVTIESNGKIAVISKNASQDLRNSIFSQL